jgi:hypothetical protein
VEEIAYNRLIKDPVGVYKVLLVHEVDAVSTPKAEARCTLGIHRSPVHQIILSLQQAL